MLNNNGKKLNNIFGAVRVGLLAVFARLLLRARC